MEELREVLLFCLIYAAALGAALVYTIKPGRAQSLTVPTPPTRRPENEVF